MDVLMLNYEFPPLGGGAGRTTARLLEQFAAEPDLHVELVTSSIGQEHVERPHKNVLVHFLDVGKRDNLPFQTWKDLLAYSWKAWRYARRLVREHRYHLCHAFCGIPSGRIARTLGLPYIVSLRGPDVPFFNDRFRYLDRLFLQRTCVKTWKRAKAVVANSTGLRDLALKSAPRQDIRVIPNGVDGETFAPAPARIGKGLRVLAVSHLIPRKGLRYLVGAVFDIHDLDVTLTLVGAGNHEVALRDASRELRAAGRMHLLGVVPHEDLPALYREHDVFVLPSLGEGMSNAVLEAMASGLPILMTDTGGTRELLENGKNGFIIQARSKEDIARRLRGYLADGNLAAEHGKRSRQIAENFSWRDAAQSYVELYRSAVKEKQETLKE